ncbi:MAG TPA: NAD(P)H-dependent oxidoreductase [Bacteroidia bacterium]|nr:NAD(P)H-dependent oxidoreductase [Bacteroidia bacterium]
MNKILILFAHPLLEKSRIHKSLLKSLPTSENITFRDLYELYPDFNIDVKKEKQLLLEHDIIIWQHPVYWYSVPPLLKQWIDVVLEFGWAYGPGGNKLQGKFIFNAISSGGQQAVYSPEGKNRFTIRQFLAPLDQTAVLCHLTYLPPFVVHGTHLLNNDQINEYAKQYRLLLLKLE